MGYWYAGNWEEGDRISLKINDPSLLFGATIFTTLRVHGGDLEDPRNFWLQHYQRLLKTVEHLGWAAPNWERLRVGAQNVAKVAPVVRITILSDGRELIIGRTLPENLQVKQQLGIKAWLPPVGHHQRPQADFKTGNYLSAWQALQGAIAQGAGEAILTSTRGRWLETATGNLWGYRRGCWYTPPLERILPGVMRSHLITQLGRHQVPLQQVPWAQELPDSFEVIAYSNSVVGVIPFQSILGCFDPEDSLRVDHQALRQLQRWSGQLGDSS